MLQNFNFIFSNEVAKSQTNKYCKVKDVSKMMYFESYVIIKKVTLCLFHIFSFKGVLFLVTSYLYVSSKLYIYICVRENENK